MLYQPITPQDYSPHQFPGSPLFKASGKLQLLPNIHPQLQHEIQLPAQKGSVAFPSRKYGVSRTILTRWGANLHQIIITSLETQGRPSIEPFPIYTPPPIILTTAFSQNISLIINSFQSSIVLPTEVANNISPSRLSQSRFPSSKMDRRGATDCFQPVATGALPSQFPSRGDHPVPRLGIVSLKYPKMILKCQRS